MQQPAMTIRNLAGTPAHDACSVPLPLDASTGLPPWESFPAGDRHQLVRVLIQTARRQIPRQPAHPDPFVVQRGGRHDAG
jgi:hypothetical protein